MIKKINYLLLSVFLVFSIGCETGITEDIKPFRGEVDPCDLDPTVECDIDDDDDGGGGSPGGGSTSWKDYYYTHKGESNSNLYFAGSDSPTGAWTTGQIGAGAQTSEGPATVFFNNKLFVYYKGNSSNNIFYTYKSSPNGSWLGNSWINSGSKTSGNNISATVHDGKIFIAYRGESNNLLYLAYSTDGMSFTQIQPSTISIMQGSPTISKDQFTITSNGGKLYIFIANNLDHTMTWSARVYWYSSSTPTVSSSWGVSGTYNDFMPNNDYSNRIELFNGISATSYNGNIYLAWAYADKNAPLGTENNRLVCWSKLSNTSISPIFASCDYATKRRPGITSTDDGKLMISFIGNSSDKVNIFTVNPSNGNIINSAYESGGEAKVGGVQLTNTF